MIPTWQKRYLNVPTVSLILAWSVIFVALAVWCGYWFIAFYQKTTRGNRDRFAPAFMLQYLSLMMFFLFMAAIVPTGRLYDELSILCGMIATLIVLLAFGLLHYEIYQERKKSR